MPRTNSLLVAAALCLSVVLGFPGCESLARSQGRFPAMIVSGERALSEGKSSAPERGPLHVKEGRDSYSLLRFGYRNPWSGKLVNAPTKANGGNQNGKSGSSDSSSQSAASTGGGLFGLDDWDGEGLYIVVDVGPALRDPWLGTMPTKGNVEQEQLFKTRLVAIAQTLIIAADYNGETYWRHLSAFLKTYEALQGATTAATGAGAAAAFVAPPLSASLTGGALIVDAFVGEFTSGLEINNYAALREATAIYRKALRHQLLKKAKETPAEEGGLAEVLSLAHEYAFSYSIQGTIAASQQQTAELKALLENRGSKWREAFVKEPGDKDGQQRTKGAAKPAEIPGSAQ